MSESGSKRGTSTAKNDRELRLNPTGAQRNIDIFEGYSRSHGSRHLDYKSQQKVSHERTQKERQWEIESNFLERREKNKSNKNEGQGNIRFSSTPRQSSMFTPNSKKNEDMKKRMGMTEQMEKYISHDLRPIQEEQEVKKKANQSLSSVINMQYLKSKEFDPRTTARLTHDFKYSKDQYNKMKEMYLSHLAFDRQSNLQKMAELKIKLEREKFQG